MSYSATWSKITTLLLYLYYENGGFGIEKCPSDNLKNAVKVDTLGFGFIRRPSTEKNTCFCGRQIYIKQMC